MRIIIMVVLINKYHQVSFLCKIIRIIWWKFIEVKLYYGRNFPVGCMIITFKTYLLHCTENLLYFIHWNTFVMLLQYESEIDM